MILTENIKRIIERKIGADIDLIGIRSVKSAVLSGIKKSKVKTIEEYGKLLRIDNNVYNSFVEDIIVPKTWFFRNKDSYIFLKKEVVREWKTRNKPIFRVLSIPCSTGEEPYSIAATLFEAGLSKTQFHIDAMDISNNAITTAKCGVYLKNQSYLEEVDYSKRYIYEKDESIMVDDILKDQISFFNVNLLNIIGISNSKYDVIFCRNVFIYFHQKARNAVIINLKKKLKDGGMIFTGHAELNIFLNSGFSKIDSKNSFACKIGRKENREFKTGRTVKKRVEIIKKKKIRENKVKVKRVGQIEKTLIVDEAEKKNKQEKKVSAYQRIKSFADIGDYQKAMELCESYVEKMEPNAEIYCIKGLIHQLQNSLDKAQKCFEKAIYLKPDYYYALLHMSILLEKKGRFDKSELFKKRAQKSFALIDNYENDFLEDKINE